jgi:hypothetical protein
MSSTTISVPKQIPVEYAPQFFDESQHAVGAALTRRPVRAPCATFHPQRALLAREFHFDGLRLVAAHAIVDASEPVS